MKPKRDNAAIIVQDLDDLILGECFDSSKIFYFAEKNSYEEKWIKESLLLKNVISYQFNKLYGSFDKYSLSNILQYSDIADLIKLHKIGYFLLTNKFTEAIYRFSKKYRVKVIATSYRLQKNLEDKIWFDRFMQKNEIIKPQSYIFKYHKNRSIFKKTVLQVANSWGAEGTFFVNNLKDVQKLFKTNLINTEDKILAREYVNGVTYGITVFISSKLIAVSKIRIQCFYDKQNMFRKNFAGIQWIDNQSISIQLENKINELFVRIGKLLHQKKFCGYANFDFIVDDDLNLFVIECNPRFSDASMQLLNYPELICNIRTEQIFINEGLNSKNDYIEDPEIFTYRYDQADNFQGSTLTVKRNMVSNDHSKSIIKIENGIYSVLDDRVVCEGGNLRTIDRLKKQFIFRHNDIDNRLVDTNTVLGIVVSNYPLFDSDGYLNEEGKNLLLYFNYLD